LIEVSMNTVVCLLALLLLPAQEIGKVGSTVDKKVDFTAFHTYAWEKGHEAYDPSIHKAIVDAIDAQMAAAGLKKVDAGQSDITVRYHAVRGTDVDLALLKKLQKEGAGAGADKTIGSLAIVVYAPKGTEPLWEAHMRSPLSSDPKVRDQEVRGAVAALFKTYPQPKK
jgi:uncharacterized protein DUF4136